MTIDTLIHDHSVHADLLKAAPPVGVGTLTLMGYSLSDFALILTIVYTSCLLFVLIRDKYIGYYRKTPDTPKNEDNKG